MCAAALDLLPIILSRKLFFDAPNKYSDGSEFLLLACTAPKSHQFRLVHNPLLTITITKRMPKKPVANDNEFIVQKCPINRADTCIRALHIQHYNIISSFNELITHRMCKRRVGSGLNCCCSRLISILINIFCNNISLHKCIHSISFSFIVKIFKERTENVKNHRNLFRL